MRPKSKVDGRFIETWSRDEVIYLKKNYAFGDGGLISEVLNRSWEAIKTKARRLKLRRKIKIIGLNHHSWRGGVHQQTYRRIAFSRYPRECSVCGTLKKLEVHHKDLNRKNNVGSNLQIVCVKHHNEIHGIVAKNRVRRWKIQPGTYNRKKKQKKMGMK